MHIEVEDFDSQHQSYSAIFYIFNLALSISLEYTGAHQ